MTCHPQLPSSRLRRASGTSSARSRPALAAALAELETVPRRDGRSVSGASTPIQLTAPTRTGDLCPLSRTHRLRGHDRRAESFRCVHCRLDVPLAAAGTAHRNHCPNCLWSRHLDIEPGDRASDCLASMEPIAITVRKDGEWVLIHRCQGCGMLSSNRIAGDDNPLLLVRIAVKPLAQPPFPLDRLSLI